MVRNILTYKWRALRVTLENWSNNNKIGLDFRGPTSMTHNIQKIINT
jgi:hypothetical protein